MKKMIKVVALLSTLLSGFLASGLVYADKLDDIKKAGVIKVAVFDSNPPFGFVDKKTKQLSGFDVDIANEIAKALGVKVEFQPTNPANRTPLLSSNKVDLIVANFTITEERAKTVDFSLPYFATGQKFIAKKGLLTKPDDLTNLRIGADKGTVQEITLREQYPTAKVISYDDTPIAFTALRNGNVQAITQDDAKLIGLLANLPEALKAEYEVSSFSITKEYQGIGISKGETRLLNEVNTILLNLEKTGRAEQIYNHWFGEGSTAALPRGDFKITQPAQ